MRRLIEQRYAIRRNLPGIIGLILAVYFSYHIGFGERSYGRLRALENQIVHLSSDYEQLHGQRTALEDRVTRLRPGSLDPDLLEERARYVLGYVKLGETVIVRW